jgi:hypothetical protein
MTAPGPLPTFIIVGAPRSGTTSLAFQLSAHPDVYFSPQKEVRFFDSNFERGVDWYRSHFAGATAEHAIGEKTPTYMFFDDVPARMASVVPDARLVAVLRNPIDRAYSEYSLVRARGGESRSFREALLSDASPAPRPSPAAYFNRSFYLPRLEALCRHYPRESLQVILFEDLRTDPQKNFDSLCRFLGVEPIPIPDVEDTNPANSIRSQLLLRQMRRRHAWKRMPRLAARLHAWNRTTVEMPRLGEAERAELSELFAEHNRDLARWLGRDLPSWTS